MICPNCEYEYVDGITECPDCGTELVTREVFEGNLVHPSDWVVVYTCYEKYEASMIKANLEGGGIETIIMEQNDKNFPVVGDLTLIKILVKKTDSEDAMEFLNNLGNDNPLDEEL